MMFSARSEHSNPSNGDALVIQKSKKSGKKLIFTHEDQAVKSITSHNFIGFAHSNPGRFRQDARIILKTGGHKVEE